MHCVAGCGASILVGPPLSDPWSFLIIFLRTWNKWFPYPGFILHSGQQPLLLQDGVRVIQQCVWLVSCLWWLSFLSSDISAAFVTCSSCMQVTVPLVGPFFFQWHPFKTPATNGGVSSGTISDVAQVVNQCHSMVYSNNNPRQTIVSPSSKPVTLTSTVICIHCATWAADIWVVPCSVLHKLLMISSHHGHWLVVKYCCCCCCESQGSVWSHNIP